jgi:Bromodomain/Bromodomain extra-terminal - transcription regulation
MDLGLILKKLEQKQYRTLYECADDVRLVWTNCMTYNADGSDFYILASNLSRRWEEKYSKMLTEFGLTVMMMPPSSSSAPKENTLTLEEKRTFARDLYKIQKDELGVVLMELVEKSPAAITKNAAEDEFEINVDKIDAGIFAELTAYIQTCLSKKKKNPKKAMKTS